MEKSSFFNSVKHDRKYAAADWAAYFSSFIGNGVFAKPSNGLQVIESTGMKIVVKTGSAFINGYYYRSTADMSKTLSVADGINDRIDRAVIRWSLLERLMYFDIKTGVPSEMPISPELVRTPETWEIALADIRVRAGVAEITQSDISDCRPISDLCGFVTGVVDQFDFNTLCSQFDSFFHSYENRIANRYDVYNTAIETYEITAKDEFNRWFAGIKDTLDGDTAGHLQNQINDMSDRISKTDDAITLNGFTVYNHSKSGNVHSLKCAGGGDNIKFLATAPYIEGDTFTINGTPVSLRVSQGKKIGSNLFKSNSTVIGFRNGNNLCLVGCGRIEADDIMDGAIKPTTLSSETKKLFAPAYTCGTSELTPNSSTLESGKLYIMYE